MQRALAVAAATVSSKPRSPASAALACAVRSSERTLLLAAAKPAQAERLVELLKATGGALPRELAAVGTARHALSRVESASARLPSPRAPVAAPASRAAGLQGRFGDGSASAATSAVSPAASRSVMRSVMSSALARYSERGPVPASLLRRLSTAAAPAPSPATQKAAKAPAAAAGTGPGAGAGPAAGPAAEGAAATSSFPAASSSSSGGAPPPPPPPPPRRTVLRALLRLLSLSGLTLLGLFVADAVVDGGLPRFFARLKKKDVIVTMPVIAPPEEEFDHPLNKEPTWYRWWFKLTRYLYLGILFVPVVFRYLWSEWRATPEARQEYLDFLVSRLERAGCSFLKFGQWLSMRPDMFPPDIIRALAKLRDNAPSHTLEETHAVIREQFGADVEEIFESFAPVPVASGSIAQVYRARLNPVWAAKAGLLDENGHQVREVAVKVRHPKVLEETWMDVDIIFGFVNSTRMMTVPFKKDEFLALMQKQVDFRWEGHYLTRFAKNFEAEARDGRVKFPAVSAPLLAHGAMVESWAEGESVAKIFTKVEKGFTTQSGVSPMQLGTGGADMSGTGVDPAARAAAGGAAAAAAAAAAPRAEPTAWDRVQREGKRAVREARRTLQRWKQALQGREGSSSVAAGAEIYNQSREDDEELRARIAADPTLLQAMGEDAHFDVTLLRKKQELAVTMFDMFLKMFLRDNLIHGDLHAGNVLFNNRDHASTILDAGMTVSMEPHVMGQFGNFLKALCSGDAPALIDRIQSFEVNLPQHGPGSGQGHLATNPAARAAFAKDMTDLIHLFYSGSNVLQAAAPIASSAVNLVHGPDNHVSIGDVVGQVLFCMQRHHVVLRGDVAASIMAMSVCEGLIRQLDPTLDIVLKSLPYFVRYRGYQSVASVGIKRDAPAASAAQGEAGAAASVAAAAPAAPASAVAPLAK